MTSLTQRQKHLLYLALRAHDGHSLRPDWPPEQRRALTEALDQLRGQLYWVPPKEADTITPA